MNIVNDLRSVDSMDKIQLKNIVQKYQCGFIDWNSYKNYDLRTLRNLIKTKLWRLYKNKQKNKS